MTLEIPYPQPPVFFSGLVQYRCKKLPKNKTDNNDRTHKKWCKYPILTYNQCFFPDKYFIDWYKQFSCFAISRRPFLCLTRSCRRKITFLLLLIGLFHELISMQDVGHILHLHVAQHLPSFKQSKFMHQWVISPTNENDAELTISSFDIFLNKRLPDLLKLRTKAGKSDMQVLQHT